jgi:hypothetical protein
MVVQVVLPIYYSACYHRVNGANISVIVSLFEVFLNVGIKTIRLVTLIFYVLVVWIVVFLL